MIALKRFLKNLLKSDNKLPRYIAYCVVIGAGVFIIRCENQKRIEAEIRYKEAEETIKEKEEYIEHQDYLLDSVIKMSEYLKIEVDGVKVENNALRDTLEAVKPYTDKLSKSELKKLWSGIRHNLR